jgi:MOSC domain-containing protein YiiM
MAHIFQINVSNGGVPKLAVRQTEVTSLGVVGDRQANTEVHGGPERAVSIFSLERILALQGEGHPIFPGSAGENLTISGLDWEQVSPGKRLRLGAHVLVELTKFTTPCNKIEASFKQEDYGRIAQSQHPGWSRLYARVLQAGEIMVGDPVELIGA